MTKKIYDLFIIGGGINGAAIAADAASRDLSVMLCEQNDLSSGTSSASSKLIHGGLRYLEYGEFRLVREALSEREILWRNAPHLVHPLQFIMPHNPALRSKFIIQLGLFLYDHLSTRHQISASKTLNLNDENVGKPLLPEYTKGFSYYDCWADDARLVIMNALAAEQHGATIFNYTECVTALRQADGWELHLRNKLTQQTQIIKARCVINAAGPWVAHVAKNTLNITLKNHVSLIKGSHLIIKKYYEGDHAYILQNDDKRIVFVIPFGKNHHVIGTTDVAFNGDPQTVTISQEETVYLLNIVKKYFSQPITTQDIVKTYSGVRALQANTENNPSALSRDYILEYNDDMNHAPCISIIGGKITTHRKLAEHTLELLKNFFPELKPSRTATTPLPGGDIHNHDFSAFLQNLLQHYPWLPQELAEHYAHSYGTRCELFLNGKKSLNDLGIHFGHNLYEAEVNYLCKYEWAHKIDDILWRRTKYGLVFSTPQIQALNNWLSVKQI